MARRAIRSARAAAPTPRHPGGPMPPTVTGWAPLPGSQNPSQQIGVFDGQLLNQYPALVPGVQLHCGVESQKSHWYYPALTRLPNGNLTQTTRPNNISGGQLVGSRYTGPIGPLSANRAAAHVTAAQVRQSGLAAMGWAAGLNLGAGPGQ